MPPRALILHANGSNRDHDVAQAFELAGAQADIVPLNILRADRASFADYQLLCLPGGFSYADALGAGKLFALDLNVYFVDQAQAFVASGKPVIGICNGFQALVKSDLLPGNQQPATSDQQPLATLTFNERGRFECRWVTLQPVSQTCLWTRGLTESIYCPVAHGEGNLQFSDSLVLQTQDQVALIYSDSNGSPAHSAYPQNPNGSVADIAGLCNPRGNVLGLMPHPENHIFNYQHPRWTRGESSGSGLRLFENGVKYASQM
jgi:phosphoribosylformylglycinamidine synthase